MLFTPSYSLNARTGPTTAIVVDIAKYTNMLATDNSTEINENAVVEVSYNAFEKCDTLTSVTIPSGVEIIDEQL